MSSSKIEQKRKGKKTQKADKILESLKCIPKKLDRGTCFVAIRKVYPAQVRGGWFHLLDLLGLWFWRFPMKSFSASKTLSIKVFSGAILALAAQLTCVHSAVALVPGVPWDCYVAAMERRGECRRQAGERYDACQEGANADFEDAFNECMAQHEDPFLCSEIASEQDTSNCQGNYDADLEACQDQYSQFLLQCEMLEDGLVPVPLDEVFRRFTGTGSTGPFRPRR